MASVSKNARRFIPNDRDKEILFAVFRYRLLTIDEIRIWVNPTWNMGNLRNRLRALRVNKFLQIPLELQKRHLWVGGGGSLPNVYALGPEGAKVLARDPYLIDTKRSDYTTMNRTLKASSAPHILMTARFMAALKAACDAAGYALWDQDSIIKTATPSHIQYVKSLPFQNSKMRGWFVPGVGTRSEPGNGKRIEPDHMFLITTPEGKSLFGLLEIDRGRESTKHLVSKFERYQQTFKSKLLSNAFAAGEDRFLSIIVTEHRPRMESLVKENKKALNYGDGWNRLWFACEDEFANDMLDTVWLLGGNSELPQQTFRTQLLPK